MNFQHEVIKSFATLREMLRDRGADTASLERLSGEDVAAMAAARNVFSFDLPSCRTRVVYELNPKFKPADVRKHLPQPEAPDAPEARDEEGDGAGSSGSGEAGAAAEQPATFIVVSNEQPSNAALKGILETGLDVQMFQLRELQFNVSRHESVPRHEPVRDEAEIERVAKRYGLRSRFQMPLILSSDPMARYLALKHGQLVRITRVSPTAGDYVLYRCCTSAR